MARFPMPNVKLTSPHPARVAGTRVAAPVLTQHGGITSPGGIVQRGGYMARSINWLSRKFPAMPIGKSAVGGKAQGLPKGMD